MTTQKEIVSTTFQTRAEVAFSGRLPSEGKARNFTVMCDEPPVLGGGDTAPRPLEYFLLSIGF
ncbi:MAG: hypothetical protein HY666_04815 [Chloroflexi bacterium]|nr:hypothetical protein [Chloroflexota bacterium]